MPLILYLFHTRRSMWLTARTCSLTAGQNEIKVHTIIILYVYFLPSATLYLPLLQIDFPLPIIASNIIIEFSEFYENFQVNACNNSPPPNMLCFKIAFHDMWFFFPSLPRRVVPRSSSVLVARPLSLPILECVVHVERMSTSVTNAEPSTTMKKTPSSVTLAASASTPGLISLWRPNHVQLLILLSLKKTDRR